MKSESYIAEFENLDAAYLSELSRVVGSGVGVSPRELPTMERTDCAIRLLNPRARLIHIPARRWSLNYAIGELLWHLSGSNDLEFIAYYSDVWQRFTEDGSTISGSCYGHKIFSILQSGASRWESARRLLEAHPDTRRCVISLYDSLELAKASESKDIPCCNMLQFLIRDGQLCLIVYMRSNDLMYGFVYDIFLFTMLLELMASELHIPVGWYQHVVGSLHVYDRDLSWAKRIVAQAPYSRQSMPAMLHTEELPTVFAYERQIRLADKLDPMMKFDVTPYWETMLVTLLFHKLRRLREHEGMMTAFRRLDGTCFEAVAGAFL